MYRVRSSLAAVRALRVGKVVTGPSSAAALAAVLLLGGGSPAFAAAAPPSLIAQLRDAPFRVVRDGGRDPRLEYAVAGSASVHMVRANEVIVRVRIDDPASARSHLAALIEGDRALAIIDQVPGRPIFLVRLASARPVGPAAVGDRLLLRGAAIDDLEVSPNVVMTLDGNQQGLRQRPYSQWPFLNDGAAPGARVDADIDAEEALSRFNLAASTPGSGVRSTIVAVLDSGLDVFHPAFARTLWVNPAEVPGNGLDDDHNGYKDDINGWNFADNSAQLQDVTPFHGTHVAGIVGMRPAAKPLYGVSPAARILMAKLVFTQDKLDEFTTTKAVYYAIGAKADVINMSFGSGTPLQELQAAILTAWEAGIHVVASAGNDGADLSQKPRYPCLYTAVLCVVATGPDDKLAAFSNWHPNLLVMAAPGVDIESTKPGGAYQLKSGTSMATPIVAGAIAAIKSLHPELDRYQVLGRLFSTADHPASLERVQERTRLNLYRALFAPVQTTSGDEGYCDVRVPDPTNPNLSYPRSTKRPFANSGEPGIDGGSLATAFAICTLDQLFDMPEEHLDKIFVLKRHLDWTAADEQRGQVGVYVTNAGPVVRPFNGVLDGNGFAVRGMVRRGSPTGGLFGELGPSGLVTNLRLYDVDLSFRGAGGVIATQSWGRIFNVQVEGQVVGQQAVGGLVGQMRGGIITASFFEGQVAGDNQVGGLVGWAQPLPGARPPRIELSQVQGIVRGSQAGGLVGSAHSTVIAASHAEVDAGRPGAVGVGGLVGSLICRARIVDSYAEGRLSGQSEIGGLVGSQGDADIASSYAATSIVGAADLGGVTGIKRDALEVIIPQTPVTFRCTGTSTKPSPSSYDGVYYDKDLTVATGEGQGRTTAQLRDVATFVGWKTGVWRFQPTLSPLLLNLPRSRSKFY